MTAGWIIILLALATAAAVAFTSWRRRTENSDLGTVSAQWLAEQRANGRHAER